MKDWHNRYPPYEGKEPYLYLAFAEADSGKAWEIQRLLLERGCRVWYQRGPADSPEEVLRRQTRYKGAALTLVYLSDEACRDPNTKSNVLVNQNDGSPVLCLDPDGKDRRLAMGLKETIPHIPLYKMKSEEEREEAILHAGGFSQELLGEPVQVKEGSSGLQKLTMVITALAVILVVFLFLGIKEAVSSQTAVQDQVTISDPVIESAVREAAGGGSLTEEAVNTITVISLEGMPESWEDLTVLPALKEICIPQESLLGEEPLPEGDYTIILLGGDA